MITMRIERDEGCVVCSPHGEIDAWTVPDFRAALVDLVGAPGVVIDLGDVGFMDSAGLGALIGAIRRLREADGVVAVACARPPLRRLLQTTGLDRVVDVSTTVPAAVARVSQVRQLIVDRS